MKLYSNNSHINVGSGQDLTILELTKMVCDVVGIAGKIEFDRSRPDGTPQKLMSPERMKSLGWAPRISVREGLETTYRWYLANCCENVVENAFN
jgi:GDP-L-fucose synthase